MALIRPDTVVLNWLLALPFFAALCAVLFPRLRLPVRSQQEAEALRRAPFFLGAMASLMGLALAISLLPSVARGGQITADYWWTRDLYHLRFQADVFSVPMVLVIYALALLIHLHQLGLPLLSQPHNRAALVLTAQGCAVGSCLSADLIALVLFLETTLVSLWLLASLDSRRSASRLLAITHVGTLVFIGGVLLMWRCGRDTSMAALPLLLLSAEPALLRAIALLILLGLLPRVAGLPGHGWVSALAAGGPNAALVPAAFLPLIGGAALLRLLPGSVMLSVAPALTPVGFVLGFAALWWGALRACLVHELRQLAVWLTVAQSGYLLVALGAAANPTATPELTRAASLHLLTAPLSLLALWCGAGAITASVGTDAVAGLSGLIHRLPIAGVALLLGGLSLGGVPPLPGFHVQRLLLSGLPTDGRVWLLVGIVVADVFIVVAVLDALRRTFLRREPPPPVRWASPWLSATLLLTAIALLVVGLWTGPLVDWTDLAFRKVLSISP
jgi:formate hydrogenlyase subunit 3/multisubunit Na+/H+ antiporter MnhD subunit